MVTNFVDSFKGAKRIKIKRKKKGRKKRDKLIF